MTSCVRWFLRASIVGVLAGCRGGNSLEVDVTGGRVAGARADSAQNVVVFRGIPFAAPPTGDRRWRAPRPVVAWTGTRDARTFGPACPQSQGLASYFTHLARTMGGDTVAAGAPLPIDEDCLTLNVWTANIGGNSPAPVFVWIHGGSGTQGSGRQFDGAALAARGVVVITLNYRLGVLGFLVDPALDAETPDNVSGNYALRDQIAALEWIRASIGRFGGDSTRVTLAGQSAGAVLAGNLLAAPSARGLFHRAILQSGSGLDASRPLRDSATNTTSDAQTRALAAALGLDSISNPAERLRALRAIPADRIIAVQERNPERYDATPVVDGKLLPEPLRAALSNGHAPPVPLIIGWNAQEMGSLVIAPPTPPTVAQFRGGLTRDYGSDADSVARAYPATTSDEAWNAWLSLKTDQFFGLELRRVARAATAAHTPMRVFIYEFTRRATSPIAARLGAYHSAELPFVFGVPSPIEPEWTAADRALADTMMTYWVQFAATGDPNRPGAPRWPAFTAPTEAYLEIGHPIRAGERMHAARYDLLERIEKAKR